MAHGNEQLDFEAKVEEFYTYNEINDIIIESKGNPEDVDIKTGASSLVLSIARNMSAVNTLVLENLTGVELQTAEKRYDYLTKALNINGVDVAKMGMAQLSDTNPKMFADALAQMFAPDKDMGVV